MGSSDTIRIERKLFQELEACDRHFASWKLIRDHIVARNMGLVYAMMRRRGVSEREWDEVFGEASMALVRAVKRFDLSRGFKFSTYACRAIVFEIIRVQKLEKKHKIRFVTGYEEWLGPAKGIDIDVNLMAEDVRRKIQDDSTGLTERESHILYELFGLRDGRGRTLREVGESIGISKERVRQIQNEALSKLREAMEAA